MALALPLAIPTYSREYFLTQSFGENLEELSQGKKAIYRDGIFTVFEVTEEDEIYQKFSPFESSESIWVQMKRREFQASPESLFQYKTIQAASLDGSIKTVLYIPREDRMIFIYATAIL